MNRKCLCFISGLSAVGMLLSRANVNASDGAEVDYGREWNPYVTLRGGWLFGKAKCNEHIDGVGEWNVKDSIKSAWSGSGEFGVSHDDRVFVGLELGYFTGKMKIERNYDPMPHFVVPAGASPLMPGGGTIDLTKVFVGGKMKNFFGACNVTMRHDIGERAFLYGGIGAGVARSRCSGDCAFSMLCRPAMGVAFTHRKDDGYGKKSKWRFLGQAFAGFGVYLNDNWQLTAGYRLRYVPGSFEWCETLKSGQKWSWKVKQDIIHAAEVGLTYQF